MEQLSYVVWLLGALFSIAVLGLLSESVLGGSQTRKVVISLEMSFKILVFKRVAETEIWVPCWLHFGLVFDTMGAVFAIFLVSHFGVCF